MNSYYEKRGRFLSSSDEDVFKRFRTETLHRDIFIIETFPTQSHINAFAPFINCLFKMESEKRKLSLLYTKKRIPIQVE